MPKITFVIVAGILLAAAVFGAGSDRAEEPAAPLQLKPDLVIGIDAGDENLVFGGISFVDLDEKGNIYILDYKLRKIVVCDSEGRFLRAIAVPAGQGPREATNLTGIAVTPGGTLFINDTRKVIVYGPNGVYLRTFLVDFMIFSIGCAGTEELVAIGPNGGKIFHVFDPAGKLLASFGDTFRPPGEFAPMKDMPGFGAPFLFNCAKDGRLFVLNPYKYEVSVFKDRKLNEVLQGRNEAFIPMQRTDRVLLSAAAHIVSSRDLVFVAFQNDDPWVKKTVDVFLGGKQIGSLDIPGMPCNVDAQGRIYFAEEEEFPRVVRYTIKKN